VCGNSASKVVLAEARSYPYWDREDGGCPACVQQDLLRTRLGEEDTALHEGIQTAADYVPKQSNKAGL
jgi:hypothetical protein